MYMESTRLEASLVTALVVFWWARQALYKHFLFAGRLFFVYVLTLRPSAWWSHAQLELMLLKYSNLRPKEVIQIILRYSL